MAKHYLVKHPDDPWVNRTYVRIPWQSPYKHRRFFSPEFLRNWRELHQKLDKEQKRFKKLEKRRDAFRIPAKEKRAELKQLLSKANAGNMGDTIERKVILEKTIADLEAQDDAIRQGAYSACKVRIQDIEKKIAENASVEQYQRMLDWATSVREHSELWEKRAKEIVDLYEKAKTKKVSVPDWVTENIEERKAAMPMKHGPKPKGEMLTPVMDGEMEYIIDPTKK